MHAPRPEELLIKSIIIGDGRLPVVEKTVAAAGGLRAVTGLISKAGPDRVRLVTPTATVGIRGTEFDARLCGPECRLEAQGIPAAVPATPQDVTAETMDGSVELAGGTARARVKTVSGDILLRGASRDLGASTLSGHIVVRAAGWQRGGTGVQRGKFESVTGDIRFEGELGRGGVVEVES